MKNNFTLSLLMILMLNACGQGNYNNNEKKWIYDFEGVLSDSQEYVLDSIIRNFESQTTNEIAVVTVDNIGEFDKMIEYAVDFGEKHAIGKKEKNNGLVILFSKNMRQTFLATGYGTEKILKDELCKEIVESKMVPYFKEENYFAGLKAGLEECITKWK